MAFKTPLNNLFSNPSQASQKKFLYKDLGIWGRGASCGVLNGFWKKFNRILWGLGELMGSLRPLRKPFEETPRGNPFISTLQIPFERSFTRSHTTLLWGPLRRFLYQGLLFKRVPQGRPFIGPSKDTSYDLLWGPLKACEEPSDRSPDCGREGPSDRSPNCGREGPLLFAQGPLREVWNASKMCSKALNGPAKKQFETPSQAFHKSKAFERLVKGDKIDFLREL